MPFPTLQQIIVNSMHRYQPRLHIVESQDAKNLNWDNFHTFIFPGTQFTTVTAYQNDKVETKVDTWGRNSILYFECTLHVFKEPYHDYSLRTEHIPTS